MRVIFPGDLERQFDAVLLAANLLCTKEELLAYDETPNRMGHPKRVCNASVIYCREYKKRLRLRGTFFHVPGGARTIIRRAARAWKVLDPAEKEVFELAATLMRERFQRDHPKYKYQPEKKNRQHNLNTAASADTQQLKMQPQLNVQPATASSSIPDEEPAIVPGEEPDIVPGEEPATFPGEEPAIVPGEEPATASGGGGPAMPGRGLAGLPSPSTSPQTLPHTTQTKEQTATQSLPHTTTQTFDNSSPSNMTPPQYYYPSPQETREPTGSDALSILSPPPDEYLPTPWMTPGSTTYEPGTHDMLLGQRLYPDLADIEVVLREEGLEDPKDILSEGEFVLLFRTGHYDYLENIDDPLF